MEITEQAIHLLAKMATEVQARFVDFSDLAHGWEHVHRVYHLALYLAEQEHAPLPLARSDAASRAGMPSAPHRSRLCKDKPRPTSP